MGKSRKEKATKVINGEPVYMGEHTLPLRQEKERRKKFVHPIFMPDPYQDDMYFVHLEQVVNVYQHGIEDFEFNSKAMIQYFCDAYGDVHNRQRLNQHIEFRVYKGQKEPFSLPLFAFFMNYTMIILPVLIGVDMKHWQPWVPEKWTASGWDHQMDQYIYQARPFGNHREICEYVAWSKYLLNLWCNFAGDRLSLSISNNDFLEVAKRSERARILMNCEYDIPDDIEPSELEHMKKKFTGELLDTMSAQTDLPISVYTRNGLFNPGQASEFFVLQGYKPDLYDHTIQMTHHTNIIKGLKNPIAFMVDAYGGRKAEILKLNVSDAGAFERSLTMLMSNIRHVDPDYECDSKHFRIRIIQDVKMLENLEGRVATLKPSSDEYFIIMPTMTDLIGKKLYIKTPITCTHPRRSEGYICSACYGKLMSQLNCDVHIGRLAGLNSADEIEQKLLSAKHALNTNTNDIEFNELFDAYFTKAAGQIRLNDAMLDEAANRKEDFDKLYLEFHLPSMTKSQDGEGRHYDRSVSEIIIYNEADDTTIAISEENGVPIYLSPEFVIEYFLKAAHHHNPEEPLRIPFSKLITKNCDRKIETLFEYQYVNNGIAKPLLTMQEILTKTSRINSFDGYDDLLNTLIPLFVAGGIHLPEFQQELLVSQLVCDEDGQPIDWTLEKPNYQFQTIDKAIYNKPAPITSILYHESSNQLAGAYGTYEKSAPDDYSWYLLS